MGDLGFKVGGEVGEGVLPVSRQRIDIALERGFKGLKTGQIESCIHFAHLAGWVRFQHFKAHFVQPAGWNEGSF